MLTTGTVVAEVFKNNLFYDSLDRMVLQLDNAGRATDVRYDSLGRTVALADANGPHHSALSLPRRGATTNAVALSGTAGLRREAGDKH